MFSLLHPVASGEACAAVKIKNLILGMFRGTVLLCFVNITGLFELASSAGGVCKSRECPGEAGELQAGLAALLLIQVLMQVFHCQAQESLQNGNCSEAKEFCGTVLFVYFSTVLGKMGEFWLR